MSTISKKVVYQAKYFAIEQKVIERNGKTFTKDFINRNPAVFILPIAENGDVHLIRQYRDSFETYTLEVIAGMMEKSEDPLETAKRELQEETGLHAKKWTKIATWELSVNMNSPVHVYTASDLIEGQTHLDDDEVIERIVMPLDEAIEKIISGEIVASSHAAVLLLYDKMKKEKKI